MSEFEYIESWKNIKFSGKMIFLGGKVTVRYIYERVYNITLFPSQLKGFDFVDATPRKSSTAKREDQKKG